MISALHMARNVKGVTKPTTGHECVTQSPSEKHIADIEKILEDARGLEPEIDKIRKSHTTRDLSDQFEAITFGSISVNPIEPARDEAFATVLAGHGFVGSAVLLIFLLSYSSTGALYFRGTMSKHPKINIYAF